MKMKTKIIESLRAIVEKDNVILSLEERISYNYDSTRLEYLLDVAVKVINTDQISYIFKFANEEKIPVTPRGAANGLSGGYPVVYFSSKLLLSQLPY